MTNNIRYETATTYKNKGVPTIILEGMQVQIQGRQALANGVIVSIDENQTVTVRFNEYPDTQVKIERIKAWNPRRLNWTVLVKNAVIILDRETGKYIDHTITG